MITASDWWPISKNTLQGFLTLTLSPSGIVLKECSLHERPDGKRWVGLPSKPRINSATGSQRKDAVSGKGLWSPVVEILGHKLLRASSRKPRSPPSTSCSAGVSHDNARSSARICIARLVSLPLPLGWWSKVAKNAAYSERI